MTHDTTPATKADIKTLMDAHEKVYDEVERRLVEILTEIEGWKNEIVRRFDGIVEQIRDDLQVAQLEYRDALKHTSRDLQKEVHFHISSM